MSPEKSKIRLREVGLRMRVVEADSTGRFVAIEGWAYRFSNLPAPDSLVLTRVYPDGRVAVCGLFGDLAMIDPARPLFSQGTVARMPLPTRLVRAAARKARAVLREVVA